MELIVSGHALASSASSHTPASTLKEAKEYYELFRENIMFLGGAGFDVTVSSDRKYVVIRHVAFSSSVEDVRIPYNARSIKNHWVSFQLYGNKVLDYFNWVKSGCCCTG